MFRITCSVMLWGGRNTANTYHWRVQRVLAVYMDHTGFAPVHGSVYFPSLHCSSSRFLKPALQGCCPNWALRFMHFPGLSCSGSGSQVLHKGTDMDVPVFCALPSSEQLRQPCAWQVHLPRWAVSVNHHPLLATWFPGCSMRVPSQVLCVSSGELISGCNPPGRCQPSRIPGRHG